MFVKKAKKKFRFEQFSLILALIKRFTEIYVYQIFMKNQRLFLAAALSQNIQVVPLKKYFLFINNRFRV
ncbi:hypothetical protein N824_14920 [Pedobacter sp. V48]|nr:hypothetical protein N824_14920 [Pedobacter sp. V48]